LSADDFALREERLYARPYADSSIVTWGLVAADGTVPASLDVLDVSLAVAGAERSAGLIAFVLADPSRRGQGFGKQLLETIVAREGQRPLVLFSDIGPAFYERFGFQAFPHRSAFLPAGEGPLSVMAISPVAFLEWLCDRRQRAVRPTTTAFLPSRVYLDWVLTRYRFFAEVHGTPFPTDVTWMGLHNGEDHAMALVPWFQHRRTEALWMVPHCSSCRRSAAAIAHGWGTTAVRFFERGPAEGAAAEWPMLRTPNGETASLTDVQLIDWW
jgi:GNAT superfamily N-acetyltransferase